ncbi:unnamed protein product [Prunus brigantina]
MSSARIGRREAGLGSKKRGDAPPPFHGISKITLKAAVRRPGKVPEGTLPSVPRPARGDPLSPREQLEQSTDSRRVRDRDPRAQPSSQSFSRGYGSILPTSLAYIVPSTGGCSPWRLDAGRRGRTGHHATCGALPAAGPYLRPSRFRGGRC